MCFVNFLKSKGSVLPIPSPGKISLAEMHTASRAIVKTVQGQYFLEELQALQSESLVKNVSKLSTLYPVLLNGVICVGGRLRHAPVASQAIHPLVIPSERPIATLLI